MMGVASKIEWRTVPSFPDYEVSEDGGLRRRTPGRGARVGRVLRTPIDHEGYPTANIAGQPRRLHVLVAEAFIGPVGHGVEVHHRNEVKTDAHAGNLEILPHLAHGERHRRPSSRLRRHGQGNPVVFCECGCGAIFPQYDASGRPRRYITGHNAVDHDHRGRFAATERAA